MSMYGCLTKGVFVLLEEDEKWRFHADLPIGGCMGYINIVCLKAVAIKCFLFT
jgi:hypothetical protein